ncbi:MAG: rhomboid family intramembrane serine protease [Reinekea sp.]
MNLLIPTKGYIASPVMVYINGLVFLILVAINMSFTQFSNQSIFLLGANLSNAIDQGQWWRFVSSMFLHLSVLHLLFNCAFLLFLGRFLEPMLGTGLYIVLYFATGIAGSLASYLFNKDVFSAGASGAIFGLVGIFIAILLSNIIQKQQRDELLKTFAGIIGLNLALGLVLNVDNAAHIGGLASGIVGVNLQFVKSK